MLQILQSLEYLYVIFDIILKGKAMNYNEIIFWCDIAIVIAYVVMLLFFWYYLTYFFLSFKKPKKYEKADKYTRFAVIIPARDESRVIKGIISSLDKQTYPKEFFDAYIVVESKDDPTVDIVKNSRYSIVYRGELTNRRRKGFAIEDCLLTLKRLRKYKTYDAFMIFDADNLFDTNYIEKMNDLRISGGYEVGFGYRNFLNATKNYITINSAIQLAMLNGVFSKGRSILFDKIMLNGTGYYIDREVIDGAGGWIFNGLTEDVELTTYCTYHNVKMGYCEEAQYYDEEPETHKVMHKQHIRWVWGYLEDKSKFKKKGVDHNAKKRWVRNLAIFEYNFLLWPVVVYFVLAIISFLVMFALFLSSFYFEPEMAIYLFLHSLIPLSSIYLLGFLGTAGVLIANRKHFQFTFWQNMFGLFTFSFWFFDFIFAFFDGLFHKKKRTSWTKIPHKGSITNKKIK